MWITTTLPARRLAASFGLSRFRAATEVLYDSAMLLRVSPFFTLWYAAAFDFVVAPFAFEAVLWLALPLGGALLWLEDATSGPLEVAGL